MQSSSARGSSRSFALIALLASGCASVASKSVEPSALAISAMHVAPEPSIEPAWTAQDGGAPSVDEINQSNNPLNNALSVNVQDQYTPELYDSSAYTNDLLLRVTAPMPPNSFVPVPQLIRATLPISSRPDPDGGYENGFGDLNIFDIFLVDKVNDFEIGVGPLFTLPTATDDVLGTEKWQLGAAALGVHASEKGLLGGLLQWQTSFAGDDDRDDVQTLLAQPFLIHNMADAWYLRSTAIWTFNLENGDYFAPFGLGAGRVFKGGTNTYNVFVEPQLTVFHEGNGVPEFSIFFGVNTTFGK
jgi:hypothetical protein